MTAAPVKVTPAVNVSAASSASAEFHAISSYGWSQDNDNVDVDILDDHLQGIGSLPKEQVECQFTTTSFDLKIHNHKGRNLRLRVTNLDKDIVPEKCRTVVKKNRITLVLKKKGQWDHWNTLVGKKLRSAEEDAKKAADPSAGIMDMMKQMYEDGDDQTKKIIAEAWTKSRDKQAGTPGLGGAGGLGGLGGMGGMGDLDM
jgi:calcyclin binding protein